MNALAIVQLLDAITTLAINAGVSVQKYNTLREQGPLTADDLAALAAEFEKNLEKL